MSETIGDPFEVCFFDEDPDGDPDRAGDGYYFQIHGQEDWSGPWFSTDEAVAMAREDIENAADDADSEVRAAVAGLAAAEAALTAAQRRVEIARAAALTANALLEQIAAEEPGGMRP